MQIIAAELLQFAIELIDRYKREIGVNITPQEKNLSREEVKEMCGVCDATLWH